MAELQWATRRPVMINKTLRCLIIVTSSLCYSFKSHTSTSHIAEASWSSVIWVISELGWRRASFAGPGVLPVIQKGFKECGVTHQINITDDGDPNSEEDSDPKYELDVNCSLNPLCDCAAVRSDCVQTCEHLVFTTVKIPLIWFNEL